MGGWEEQARLVIEWDVSRSSRGEFKRLDQELSQ